MADIKNTESRMDDLLKKVLDDDLPPEVEARMKAQFVRFKENFERTDRATGRRPKGIWQHLFLSGPPDRSGWAVRREVLAFSSLAMIVFGAFLHVSGHRSAMAETLSFLNASVSIANQVQEASSMECHIQLPAEDGKQKSFIIRWHSPEMIRVDVREGEETGKTLVISASGITVKDNISDTFQEYQRLEQITDPVFVPALEFLSPDVLATAIYEKWKPQYYREEDKDQKGTFVYIVNGERKTLEMTVDLATSLPVSISKFPSEPSGAGEVYELTLEAQFFWNEPISFMKIIDKSEKGGKNDL